MGEGSREQFFSPGLDPVLAALRAAPSPRAARDPKRGYAKNSSLAPKKARRSSAFTRCNRSQQQARGGRIMKITRTSIITAKVQTLDLPITDEQLRAYEQGALLQDAFPQLAPPEREFIKTGVTPDEWQAEVLGAKSEADKATERPWYLDEDRVTIREGGTDVIVATVACSPRLVEPEETAANAILIVRAVNAHDRLAGAARRALEYLTGHGIDLDDEDEALVAGIRLELEAALNGQRG
jgi:hypothetical protein